MSTSKTISCFTTVKVTSEDWRDGWQTCHLALASSNITSRSIFEIYDLNSNYIMTPSPPSTFLMKTVKNIGQCLQNLMNASTALAVITLMRCQSCAGATDTCRVFRLLVRETQRQIFLTSLWYALFITAQIAVLKKKLGSCQIPIEHPGVPATPLVFQGSLPSGKAQCKGLESNNI